MSCGVGQRHGLDLMWLWQWHRPAAVALIGPLAWEPLYATSAALKHKKKKEEEEDVLYIHSGILLSHQKEQNNAICSNMDGTRDSHTK